MEWAVVLGMDINGLGVARSLGCEGINIMGIDSNPMALGFSSKYVLKSLVLKHGMNTEEMVRMINNFNNIGCKPVLFPTGDDTLRMVLDNKDKLKDHVILPFSPPSLFYSLINKDDFYQLMTGKNIPIPKTYVIGTDYNSIYDYVAVLGFPFYIKPIQNLAIYRSLKQKGFVINNNDDLNASISLLKMIGADVMVQEIIPGPMMNLYGTYFFNDRNGKTKMMLSYRKIREWPIRFGAGSAVITIKDNRLHEFIKGVVEGIGYCGIGDIEVKLDERDNEYKVIDLNARTGQMNYFSHKCGYNFPYLAFKSALGNDISELLKNHTVAENIVGIRDFVDIGSLLMNKKGFFPTIRDFYQSYINHTFHCVVFDVHDLAPYWTYLRSFSHS